MTAPASEEVIATLAPRTSRRALGAACLGGVGILCLSVAFAAGAEGQSSLSLMPLLVVGLAGLWAGWEAWQRSAVTLILTRDALYDSRGRMVAPIADIRTLSRGAFANKPSHGFVLTLGTALGSAWIPGIWWRVGKRVGVGGAASSAEARLLAGKIEELIADRP